MGDRSGDKKSPYKKVLDPPAEYDFPFPPYPIQDEFMTALYGALEGGKLGVFESPTGTGKSLSLICGSLKWLKDHCDRVKEELSVNLSNLKADEKTSSDDWLAAQIKNMESETLRRQFQQKLNLINRREDKIQRIRSRHKEKTHVRSVDTRKVDKVEETVQPPDVDGGLDDDGDFLLEEIKTTEDAESEEDEADEEDEDQNIKIIFCSRTHSQLSQFVNEVKRTVYKDWVTLVPLASRQNYCINNTVRKLNSVSLINEKCLEMQRSSRGRTMAVGENGEKVKKSKTGCGCPMMKLISSLGEEVLTSIHDVEELTDRGKKQGSCPYYASRGAVSDAQVVVVPYNILLHKSTREACGLKLEGNVVIIDEAHNLLDTITNIHSAQVTGQQLTHSYSQLIQYKDKYEKRFSAINLLHLKQLIYVIGNLIKIIGGKPGCNPAEASLKVAVSNIHTISDFICTSEIDNYNLYTLLEFCKQSKITHKLHGFSEKYTPAVSIVKKPPLQSGIRAFLQEISNKNNIKNNATTENVAEPENKSENILGQPLVHVLAFLECLTSHNNDGRVVCTRQHIIGKATIKYLLLNPAPLFTEIVQKARSVILAGGTMQPVSEFTEQLFFGSSPSRICLFSCGHVIPAESILPLILCSGPTGKKLDFSFQTRSSTAILNELGRLLVNVCNIVPAGIVCFFPSYDYENAVYQHLEKNGSIETISAKKKIFREPKKSSQVDSVLAEYAKVINMAKKNTSNERKQNGALLFSVVGGKLSEGLNFSDDLGRCVIVVGMPYPNIKSPELQEKMLYLDSHVGNSAGRIHYENLCMKAVNQSIGRAVRHRGDYAAMLLVDHRYSKESVQKQLPSWILRSLQVQEKFGPALAQLVKFFRQHQ